MDCSSPAGGKDGQAKVPAQSPSTVPSFFTWNPAAVDVTDASSDDEGWQDEASTFSEAGAVVAWPQQPPKETDLLSPVPFEEVFSIPFCPIEESLSLDKRCAVEAFEDSELCCSCNRPNKKKRMSNCSIDIDELSFLDDVGFDDLLLDDGVGLDDYLQLSS
jgi:hypothetical protein